jgi:hypothetical protein
VISAESTLARGSLRSIGMAKGAEHHTTLDLPGPRSCTSRPRCTSRSSFEDLSDRDNHDLSDQEDHAGTHAHIFTPPREPSRKTPDRCDDRTSAAPPRRLLRCAAVQHMQALMCQSHIQRLVRRPAPRAEQPDSSSDDGSDGEGYEVKIFGDGMKARIEDKLARVGLLQKMELRQSFYELEKGFDATAYMLELSSSSRRARALRRTQGGGQGTDGASTDGPPVAMAEASPLKTSRDLSGCAAMCRATADRRELKLEWSALTGTGTAPSALESDGGAARAACATASTAKHAPECRSSARRVKAGTASPLGLGDPALAVKQTWKQLLAEIRIAKTTRIY